MNSIFKTRGFDTLLGKNATLNGSLLLTGATVIDGVFTGDHIKVLSTDTTSEKAKLSVNGSVTCQEITIDDLYVSGHVKAQQVRVTGTLAIKAGCVLRADDIYYQYMVAEPGAVIIGRLHHLDHSSDPKDR